MTTTLLQTNFKVKMPRADYEKLCSQAAHFIAVVPGLVWKAWYYDSDSHEAGGFYCFESVTYAEAFACGPILAAVKENPGLADVRVRILDVIEQPSLLTRFAPVPQYA